MLRPPLRLSLAALAAGLLGLTGCSSSSSSDPSAAATARPTPISALNTDAMRLGRTSFCTRLPQRAVDQAVGGRAARGEAWKNGDTAEVENDVDDVVHEAGCRWVHDESTARAWVFARSVSTAQADAVIAKTAKRSGCTSAAGPGFGSPSQRQTCSLRGRRDAGPRGRPVRRHLAVLRGHRRPGRPRRDGVAAY